ncbi:MAG: hypothetical protein EHM40_13105 [Chloroflexi bacterium]|nr:MAG: hypothetical protein EHM40_13105 [Chloroflexota bacterium]
MPAARRADRGDPETPEVKIAEHVYDNHFPPDLRISNRPSRDRCAPTSPELADAKRSPQRTPDRLPGPCGCIGDEFGQQDWATAPQKTRDLIDGLTPLVLEQSGEEGINMIRALLGLGDLVTNVNMENAGQISNAPLHAVVETNAYFSRAGVRPLSAGGVPGRARAAHQSTHCQPGIDHRSRTDKEYGPCLPGILQ